MDSHTPGLTSKACRLLVNSKAKLLGSAALVSLLVLGGCQPNDEEKSRFGDKRQPLRLHTLENEKLRFRFTPDIGGRGLFLGLKGRENIFKVDEPLARSEPHPDVSAEGPHIPYFGHILWVGPQSQWWRHQSINKERAERGAGWPPDPFTVLAANSVRRATEREIHVVSPPSPVTGLQLVKGFALNAQDPHRLDLTAEAVNTRELALARDLWYNTRVPARSSVYVPVDEQADFWLEHYDGETLSAGERGLEQGVFAIESRSPEVVEAKAFIQPSAGWIASFIGEQLFIVEFELLPKAAIHPDQGQVEIYLKRTAQNQADNVLELEIHGEYQRLAPGESLQLSEQWYLYPWQGGESSARQLAELRRRGYL